VYILRELVDAIY